MERLKKQIKAAEELLKDKSAADYAFAASELLLMIEANNKGKAPTKESASKETLFQTIIDSYYLGFSRGMRYQSEKKEVQPVYTREHWAKDKDFKAAPGQEITADIYNEMYNCMPPLSLPAGAADLIRSAYGLEITEGFLMAEPYGHNQNGLTFLSFGRTAEQYYFFGEMNR